MTTTEGLLAGARTFPLPDRPRPKGIRKGADGSCYRRASILTSREGWTYCEGVACGFLSPRQIPQLCMYVPHAWCLDERGLVVETVWRELSHSYLGVTVPSHDVAVFNIETGWFDAVYPELANGLAERFGLGFDP